MFLLVATGSISAENLYAEADERITVWIAGDSTASIYKESLSPRKGWGQVFDRYFDGSVIIRNEAVSGRSTKSYIDEGRLDRILFSIKPNDYLFIQFGHNDEKKDDPERYTEPHSVYKNNLRKFIEKARKTHAIPILLTPVSRRSFKNDKISDSHGEYPSVVRELGKELNVPVIDITEKSRVLFEKLGSEGTKKIFLILSPGESPHYPKGVEDNTHFQEQGALEIARLVSDGIRELNLPLAQHLKK
jgi:lysophospholipase L1-like esterase